MLDKNHFLSKENKIEPNGYFSGRCIHGDLTKK